MSRSRWLLLIGAVILSALLTFFLHDAIYEIIVLPLVYLWWLIRFYYSLVPQLFLWTLLLLGLFVIVLATSVPSIHPARRRESRRRARGQVELLAMWLARAPKGNYFKWQIANRLGKVALGLDEMSGRQSRFGVRNEAVERYLDAGLNTSFVDYPRATNPFQHPAPTNLDLDPKEAVEYLESQLENGNGKRP